MFYNNGAGLQRPPSRHKDPPQNLGLDLPGHGGGLDEPNHQMFVDDDSDSGDAFEIGIAKANKKSINLYNNLQEDDSMDQLPPKNSNRALEVSGSEFPPDFTVNDFMNSQANRRRIQTANKKGKFKLRQ